MAKITEDEVVSPFIGKELNDRYAELASGDFAGFCTLYNRDWMDNSDLRERFGLTEKLYADWIHRGIKLILRLSIDDGAVAGGFIEKVRDGVVYGSGKLDTYEMTPTQQELRIVGRILEYITRT